jgi:SAM-dependent methyltransferase
MNQIGPFPELTSGIKPGYASKYIIERFDMVGVPSLVPLASMFDEIAYLRANPDVAAAVARGDFESGRQHADRFGRQEGRVIENTSEIERLRHAKFKKLEPLLLLDMPHNRLCDKIDFLTDELRNETKIVHTETVSENQYDHYVLDLISSLPNGLILDNGAGFRNIYFDNVVNLEIKDYLTTDVLGVGEHLPFRDGSFDAVLSIAVLEHVRDPFKCAKEIVRVLKPGGRLICAVPFLQPLHGYPHHYYNMTHQGLRALFEDYLMIDRLAVDTNMYPIFALSWILQRYAENLPPIFREQFLNLRISDVAGKAMDFYGTPLMTEISNDGNFELACGTYLFASKAG